MGDAVLSTDLAGNVTYVNHAAEIMTGWSMDAAAGRPLEEVFHIVDGRTRQRARNPMSLAVKMNRTVGLTPYCILIRRDGQEAEIEDSAAPIRGHDGTVTGAVMVFRDVGRAMDVSRQMSHLAQHDVLTGLPNRQLLDDRLTGAIALARRRHRTLAVFFMDVDGFKGINDTRGHAVGDRVLREIAARLRGALRQSDTVSRYGGDEFVILLSEIEHADDAAAMAAKLREAVAGPYRIDSEDVTITVSLGGAVYPDHGRDAHTLVANADAAMYRAKRAGPGAYRLFDAGLSAETAERRSIQGGLRAALDHGEFELLYQPQIDLASRTIIGVEALLRWLHPRRGLLRAAEFVPVATECGDMVSIGQWALRESCRQAHAWQAAGLRPLTVTVNISAVEFWRNEFLDDVQAILEQTGLGARYLELELSEDVLMQDVEAAIVSIQSLKDLGIRVIIDRFGVGRSSLSDLQCYAVDALKVDPSFVGDSVARHERGGPLLTAIVAIGKSLNCRVMATGVESEAQLAFLQAAECREAQGYLFSHPVGADEIAELLAAPVRQFVLS